MGVENTMITNALPHSSSIRRQAIITLLPSLVYLCSPRRRIRQCVASLDRKGERSMKIQWYNRPYCIHADMARMEVLKCLHH